MKQPLSRDEWKWVIVIVVMLTIVCLGFGLIIREVTGSEMFLPLSGLVWLWFLYMYIIAPIVGRI